MLSHGAGPTEPGGAVRARIGEPVTIRFLGEALAFMVPLACYLATASGHGYWLDAGAFVAAASDLGIGDPPGHPLSGLLSYAATLVPLGALDFRVAVLGSIAAAFASLFFYRALLATVETVGIRAPRVAVPLAIGGTWLLVGSAPFWLEGIRPEVYAIEAALLFRAIERLIELDRGHEHLGALPLYDASLCIGLALANHHFLALLVLPAAAPTLARVVLARGSRPLVYAGAFALLGMSTYAYLPLRAAAEPYLNLGEPKELGRFLWVLSARALEGAPGGADGVRERFTDAMAQLGPSLGWATPFAALGGALLVLRNAMSRRPGALWILIAASFLGAHAWLGLGRSSSDGLGCLLPAFGAVAALATTLVAVLLGLLSGDQPSRPRPIATLSALALCALAAHHAVGSGSRASLASFTDTDVLADPMRRDLPTGAVVLAHDRQTIFHYLGNEAGEHLRPDVILVPVPLLTYPGLVDSLSAAHPELRELLRGYLLHGELRQPDLQSLAAQRPLMIEMDVRVPPALYETMTPSGLYHAVLPDGATGGDEGLGRVGRAAAFGAIERGLSAVDTMDERTRSRLRWTRYTGALYYAGFGDREAALQEVRAGLALDETQELRALEAALVGSTSEDGPIDVLPFLVF